MDTFFVPPSTLLCTRPRPPAPPAFFPSSSDNVPPPPPPFHVPTHPRPGCCSNQTHPNPPSEPHRHRYQHQQHHHHQSKSPSASQKSTSRSIICDKGTGCGSRASPVVEKIDSMIVSTSTERALIDTIDRFEHVWLCVSEWGGGGERSMSHFVYTD
jgi:hypothetical protein